MTAMVFRKAAPPDTKAIMAFLENSRCNVRTSRDEVDAWLLDPLQEISVGEMEGDLVCLSRISTIGNREAFIDWHLVRDDLRTSKVGHALLDHQTECALRLECRVVRAGWQASNTTMQRIGARLGYHRVASFATYSSEALSSGAPAMALLADRDYSEAQNWLGQSSILRASAGLFSAGGRWMELTGRAVRRLISGGRVLGMRGASGSLDAFAITEPRPEDAALSAPVAVQYLDGAWHALERLALGLRGTAEARSAGRIVVRLVDDPTIRGAFHSAGFRDDSVGNETWVVERLL